MARRLPIAREGWPFIVASAAVAGGLTLIGRRRLALPFWAASLASLGFFRDPEREIPAVPNGVLSPALLTAIPATQSPHPGPLAPVFFVWNPPRVP